MKQVLIIVSSGIIGKVDFYNDAKRAVRALSEYVKTMALEKDDVAVYDSDGMIANAKDFLSESDQYVDKTYVIMEKLEKQTSGHHRKP